MGPLSIALKNHFDHSVAQRGCKNGDNCKFKHETEGDIKHKKISHFMMNNDI